MVCQQLSISSVQLHICLRGGKLGFGCQTQPGRDSKNLSLTSGERSYQDSDKETTPILFIYLFIRVITKRADLTDKRSQRFSPQTGLNAYQGR